MTPATVSRPWSTNHQGRRNKEQMAKLRNGIYQILAERQPMNERGLFYQMVKVCLIEKTEAEYHNVVVRLCGLMRESGELPWDWLADYTRWRRKPRSYSSLEDAVRSTAETYRRALWDEQDAYVEVWCEKDALSGVLYPITSEYDVPLMVVKGFSSKAFAHSAAEDIEACGKPAFIYYLGDHDPSGEKIWHDIQAKITRYAPDAEVYFEKLAVTEEQIVEYDLPTRPTKIARNPHAKGWKKDKRSIEVDAVPVEVLRDLVRDAIEQHIDQRQLEITKHAEESEREILSAWTIPVGKKRKK